MARTTRFDGGSVIWADPGTAGQVARDEFFGQPGPVTGTGAVNFDLSLSAAVAGDGAHVGLDSVVGSGAVSFALSLAAVQREGFDAGAFDNDAFATAAGQDVIVSGTGAMSSVVDGTGAVSFPLSLGGVVAGSGVNVSPVVGSGGVSFGLTLSPSISGSGLQTLGGVIGSGNVLSPGLTLGPPVVVASGQQVAGTVGVGPLKSNAGLSSWGLQGFTSGGLNG